MKKAGKFLLLVLLLTFNAINGQAIENVVIDDPGAGLRFFGASSSDAVNTESQLGTEGLSFTLIYPANESLRDGCPLEGENDTFLELPAFELREGDSENVVLLLDRGNCGFNEKVLTANRSGVNSLIITNKEEIIFDQENNTLLDVCEVDCGLSNSDSLETCESDSGCGSDYCLPAFLRENSENTTFCCVVDDLINVNVEPKIDFSVIFIGIRDGEELVESLGTDVDLTGNFLTTQIRMEERFRPYIDASALVLVLLGTFSVSLASYIAGTNDRNVVCWLWGGKPSFRPSGKGGAAENSVEDDASQVLRKKSLGSVEALESVELTMTQAICMLICASLSLVGLFFLVRFFPTQVVIGVIVLFGFGAIYATSYFFIRPILRKILPKKFAFYKIYTPKFLRCLFDAFYTVESLIGALIATSMVVVWFIFRHDLEYVWWLQNLFSVAVAIMFLSTLKLNKLSTGFYFLVGFCIYDIFMVFITPSFGGESVMLAVATAGAGGEEVVGDVLNEDAGVQVCARTEDEQMPMLFLCPRFDFVGGFSLLGLGDILIPGIFLTYIIRVDYFKCKLKAVEILAENPDADVKDFAPPKFSFNLWRKAHFYFLSAVLAYMLALCTAFLANLQGWTINGVPGQPALLYIVPFNLIVFLIQLGWTEITFLWSVSLDDLTVDYIHEFVFVEGGVKSRDLGTNAPEKEEFVETQEEEEKDKPSV